MSLLRCSLSLAVISLAAGLICASSVGPVLGIAVDAADNEHADAAYSTNHDAYLAVWRSQQSASMYDIWGRAVLADGSLQAVFNIATAPGVIMFDPVIAYSPTQDAYLVVWGEADMTGWSYWGRMISWNGPGTTSKFFIQDFNSYGRGPVIAYNSQDDEFLVVFSQSQGIAGIRVAADNERLSSLQQIVSGDATSWPDVAYDPTNNRYLLAYRSYDVATDDIKVLLKTVAPDLSGTSPEYDIVTSSDGLGFPSIAIGSSTALVTWHQTEASTESIYARRVLLNGTPQGPAGGFLVQSGTPNLLKHFADVCYVDNGMFLVAWESIEYNPSYKGNVQGRYVSSTSNRLIGERFGIDTRPGDELEPSVACTGAGQALAVLSHQPNTLPDDYDVVGYILTSRIFSDGFEAGDFGEWSSAVGNPP